MLSKKQFQEFRKDFKKSVKTIEDKYGMNIEIGNISYTDYDFTTKLTATIVPDGMSVEQIEQVEFNKYCNLFDLSENDFGRKFFANGEEFTLIGIKPRSRKYPLIAKNKNGKRYKFETTIINNLE